MKKLLSLTLIISAFTTVTFAQGKESIKRIKAPANVQTALQQKYPEAKNVAWEKEDGNYEANWGGKSGEDNSVQFSPSGNFIKIVKAISADRLPQNAVNYVKDHYKGTKITEAGKVTDANEKTFYEAEVHGRDVIFDIDGNFVKAEK